MLLCSKVLPTEIRSVLVDHESFGARSYAHIMLPSQTGVYPEFHRAEAPLNPSQFNFADASYDAFLLVGDNALRIKRSAFPWVWDLGTAWKNHTQGPVVVHVWCTVKGTFLKGLDNELTTLARSNVKGIGEIAVREGERLGASPEVLAKLLAGVFRYEGGPAQFSALRLYLRELQKARLLAKPRQFTVYEERLSTNAARLPRL
jgi:predicted solute-binding protein